MHAFASGRNLGTSMNDAPPDKYHVPQWLGDKAVRRFHAMARPAGASCNLDCTYCYYLSKHDLAGGPGRGAMDDELLEHYVRNYIASVTSDEVVFTWQGGEPTLRGLAFCEQVVALQPKHAKPGQRIENDLQTLVVQHMDEPSQVCVFAEHCGKGVGVEHGGGVYSCDHYVFPDYRLGNACTQSLGEMVLSPRRVKFGYDKSDTLPKYCRDCTFLSDCCGECPKNRFVCTPDGEPGLNPLSGVQEVLRPRPAAGAEDGERVARSGANERHPLAFRNCRDLVIRRLIPATFRREFAERIRGPFPSGGKAVGRADSTATPHVTRR